MDLDRLELLQGLNRLRKKGLIEAEYRFQL